MTDRPSAERGSVEPSEQMRMLLINFSLACVAGFKSEEARQAKAELWAAVARLESAPPAPRAAGAEPVAWLERHRATIAFALDYLAEATRGRNHGAELKAMGRDAFEAASTIPPAGSAPPSGAGVSEEIQQLRGVCLALGEALAKRCLTEANATREAPNDWPGGQEWDELVGTSHSIMRHRGWTDAGLDIDAMRSLLFDKYGSAKEHDDRAARTAPAPREEPPPLVTGTEYGA